jgi:hypothetical protein
MKSFLISVLLLMSISAIACPNLTGTYQCYDDESGYYTETVSQTGTGTNTTYTSNSNNETTTLTANSQWVTLAMAGQTAKLRASCLANKFQIEIVTNDPQMGEVQVTTSTYIDQFGNMITDGTFLIGGQTYPAESTECTRL